MLVRLAFVEPVYVTLTLYAWLLRTAIGTVTLTMLFVLIGDNSTKVDSYHQVIEHA